MIRDLAMAEAVPVGTIVRSVDGSELMLWAGLPPEQLVGRAIVTWRGMPVDDAQAMRAEMLADIAALRAVHEASDEVFLLAIIRRMEARAERLFPRVVFDASTTVCSTCDGVGHLGPATGAAPQDYGRACPNCTPPPAAPEPVDEVDDDISLCESCGLPTRGLGPCGWTPPTTEPVDEEASREHRWVLEAVLDDMRGCRYFDAEAKIERALAAHDERQGR